MRWIVSIVVTLALGGLTVGAYAHDVRGVLLPGVLKHPVSVRQDSVSGTYGGRGAAFYYFGLHSRGHMGGGYGFGK